MRAPRSRAHFAVVGTGAAALGVVDALLSSRDGARITVFDIGDTPSAEPAADTDPKPFYDAIYGTLRDAGISGFPPPKTHFGARLPAHPAGAGLVESRSFGGLTNFWGATMLPFTANELRHWPIGPRDLAPHYARIAELAGISGGRDALDSYFGGEHVNRPQIALTQSLSRLRDLTGAREAGPYRILAGANRCAIETRLGADRSCTGCGECLAGCYRGAIYSARHSLEHMLRAPGVEIVRGRVTEVDPRLRAVRMDGDGGPDLVQGFDRVFLAAGCLGTTEILMRSVGLDRANPLRTNSVHVFPILNLGPGDGGTERHVGLANLILACLPVGHDAPMAQVQVYPNPDYLWRPLLPAGVWPLLRGAVSASRPRLFWGRLFVHSDQSQSYAVTRRGNRMTTTVQAEPDRVEPARVLRSVGRAVAGTGMRVLPRPTVLQKSSVHYGSTFGYGNALLPVTSSGEVLPGIHLCDSTVFPDMPAVSPTFTIMANARRTAMEALDA